MKVRLKDNCKFCKRVTYSSIAASMFAIGGSLSVIGIWVLAFISSWLGVIALLYAFDKIDHRDFQKLKAKIKRLKLLPLARIHG